MTISILVVDDEETARMVISEFLQTKGYEVLQAGTFADARKIVNNGEADLIILDVQLPDGYGPNLLHDVARLPVRPQVIIVTAHGEVSMAVEAMKAGAQDFLEKPLNLLELEAAVKRATEVITMRRELNHWRGSQGKYEEFIVGSSQNDSRCRTCAPLLKCRSLRSLQVLRYRQGSHSTFHSSKWYALQNPSSISTVCYSIHDV